MRLSCFEGGYCLRNLHFPQGVMPMYPQTFNRRLHILWLARRWMAALSNSPSPSILIRFVVGEGSGRKFALFGFVAHCCSGLVPWR